MNRRRLLLLVALIATVAASLWAVYVPQDSLSPPTATTRVEPIRVADQDASGKGIDLSAGERQSRPPPPLALAARASPAPGSADPFGAYSWAPPPPPTPPPPPALPVLPFSYTGRMEVDGRQSYLLLEGQRTHIVELGAEVSGFRLEEAGASGLVFVHLPSKQRVPLPLKP